MRPTLRIIGVLVLCLSLIVTASSAVAAAAAVPVSSVARILGSGSSLAAPLYTEALFAFEASGDWGAFVAAANLSRNNDSSRPSNELQAEYSSSGSTAGKNGLIAGTLDFAGSDSGFSSAQYAATPDLHQIPSLAAAVVVIYNLPELTAVGATLRLDREVLPLIFAGNLTLWNDPRIVALQVTPAIGALLPAQRIGVVVRSDGSGTTNIFTQGLSAWSQAWRTQVGTADKPTWPAALAPKQAALSTGVAATVLADDYALSYSPLGDAQSLGLDFAELRNAFGLFVHPTAATVGTVLLEKGGALDARNNAQLVDGASAQSYPLVGYSYLCFRHSFTRTNCASRALLARFFAWYYTSSVTSVIARAHGLEVLPSTLASSLVALLTSSLLCNGETISAIVPEPARVLQTHATFMSSALASLLSSSRVAVQSDFASTIVPASRSATIRAVQSGAAAVGLIASSSRPGDDAFDGAIDLAASPSLAAFPLSIGAVVPIYSLSLTPPVPAVDATATLNLTLSVVASIMLGDVTQWNDPTIQSLNPLFGARLPARNITLVLFDGESEVTSLWRAVLSEHSADFRSRSGVGSNLTGLPLSALPSVVRVSLVESRAESTVLVHPNSLSFTHWSPSLASKVPAILTDHTDPTQPPLLIARSAIAACVRIEAGSDAEAAAVRSSLLSPPAVASNPDNSLAPSESSYSFSAQSFPSVFQLDLRPSVLQGNAHTCWPFAAAVYAIVPLAFTNATNEADFDRADEEAEGLSESAGTEPSQLEALRSVSYSGSGVAGRDIVNWLYWLSQGGYLLSRPASSLRQISVPESVRLAMRSALEHASIDSQPFLLSYPVAFDFASSLQLLSYLLCGIGASLLLALALFVIGWRHSPIVRASSVPFCLYLLVGGALQYACLPWLTVSEPTGAECASIVWLFTAGFSVTFGSLLLKNLRIYAIYRQRRLTVIRLTNQRLSMGLGAIVATFIAVLLVWQLAAPLTTSVSTDRSVMPPVLHTQCSGPHGLAFVFALVCMMLVLVLVTTCVSILVRHAPSEFAETKTLAFSIYICLVLYVVVLMGATLLLGAKQRQAATILVVGGIFANATATAVLMLGTKGQQGAEPAQRQESTSHAVRSEHQRGARDPLSRSHLLFLCCVVLCVGLSAWAVYCGGSLRLQMTGTQGAPAINGGVKLAGTTNQRSILIQPRGSSIAPAAAGGAHSRYALTPAPLSSLGMSGQIGESAGPSAAAPAGGWTGGRLSVGSHSGSSGGGGGGGGGGARHLRGSDCSLAGSWPMTRVAAAPAACESSILLPPAAVSPRAHLSPARAAAATASSAAAPTHGPHTRLRRRRTSDAVDASAAAPVSSLSGACDSTAAAALRDGSSSTSTLGVHSIHSLTVMVHLGHVDHAGTSNTPAHTATPGMMRLPSPSLSPASSPLVDAQLAAAAASAAAPGCSPPSACSFPLPPFPPRASPRASPLVSSTQVASKRLTLPAAAVASLWLPPAALSLSLPPPAVTAAAATTTGVSWMGAAPASAAAASTLWMTSQPDTTPVSLGTETEDSAAVGFDDEPLHHVSEGTEPNPSAAGSGAHSNKQESRSE